MVSPVHVTLPKGVPQFCFNLLKLYFDFILVHLVILTYFLGVLEVYTYRSFVRSIFLIDLRIFIFVTFISLFLLVLFRYKNPKYEVSIPLLAVLNVLAYSFIPALLSYAILNTIENRNFPNYIFSTFHVQYFNIDSLLFIHVSAIIFLFSKIILSFITWHKKISITQKVLIFALSCLLVTNLASVSKIVSQNLLLSLSFFGHSYTENLTNAMGGNASMGWVVTYTDFINRHTPKDAVIAIPPQEQSWQTTGNARYMTYFIYPRKVTRGKYSKHDIPPETTHVLISHGLWIYGNDVGWPKMPIKAEDIEWIIYLDRKTQKETTLTNIGYREDPAVEEWGIIKLKR